MAEDDTFGACCNEIRAYIKVTTRILILTYYFPPDLSAGSFRAEALVDSLAAITKGEATIDVITSMPNRYVAIANEKAAENEVRDDVTVTRIALAQPGPGRIGQAKRFIRFAWAVYRSTRGKRYDLVFATSSRLMTAVLGAGIAGQTKARLYLDIRDIFVETMLDLSKRGVSRWLIRVFEVLERWAIKRADGINIVSRGFLPYFQERYGKNIAFDTFTNGIDDAFIETFPSNNRQNNGILDIVYAGNVGDGQGLHIIIPSLAAKTAGRARFRIVGDGGRMEALQEAVRASGLTNIVIEPPVPRAKIIDIYREADVLFLHLNDVRAFERVIPSKLFEYAATGKPILAGVSGFCAQFIAEEVSNAAVFHPCDAVGAVDALSRLQLDTEPRPAFVEKYARAGIMSQMARRLLDMARSTEKDA